jgi:hypothetical protein
MIDEFFMLRKIISGWDSWEDQMKLSPCAAGLQQRIYTALIAGENDCSTRIR